MKPIRVAIAAGRDGGETGDLLDRWRVNRDLRPRVDVKRIADVAAGPRECHQDDLRKRQVEKLYNVVPNAPPGHEQ
jgi:hypothetical protein